MAIMSPGCRVMKEDRYSIRNGMSKIMSLVEPSWRSSPLIQVRRVRFCGSAIWLRSMMYGPTGVVQSRFFTRRLGR
ncbi:hypothetical protein D3C81_2009190 [compost metagenome]